MTTPGRDPAPFGRDDRGKPLRDPVSEWFDRPARNFLARAYDDYGEWVTTWLPQPTSQQRAIAAALRYDVDAADPWGHEPNAWVRAFKRSARWNLRMYGYAREMRPGIPRTDTAHPLTLMVWDSTTGLVPRPPAGAQRYEVRIKLYPNNGDALRAPASPADEWKPARGG